jgi:hypothetical protein
MTATVRETTIAARVPVDLRTDLEAIRQRSGDPDLSHTIRRILRAGADRELAGNPTGLLPSRGFANGAKAHANDPATAKAAAAKLKPPRVNTHRRYALERISHTGADGMTADELICWADEHDGIPYAISLARRVSELLQADAVEPATDPDGLRVTRPTRAGNRAQAWRITARGRRWLEQENPTP